MKRIDGELLGWLFQSASVVLGAALGCVAFAILVPRACDSGWVLTMAIPLVIGVVPGAGAAIAGEHEDKELLYPAVATGLLFEVGVAFVRNTQGSGLLCLPLEFVSTLVGAWTGWGIARRLRFPKLGPPAVF